MGASLLDLATEIIFLVLEIGRLDTSAHMALRQVGSDILSQLYDLTASWYRLASTCMKCLKLQATSSGWQGDCLNIDPFTCRLSKKLSNSRPKIFCASAMVTRRRP